MPDCGLSFFSDVQWITAVLPIIEIGEVQCLEHTLESRSSKLFIPGTLDLLREFSKLGKLIGHSLDFPLLSAVETSKSEESFFKHYRSFSNEGLQYSQLSAHYGFVQSERFKSGAPLPMPLCESLEEHLLQQLKNLSKGLKCPAGLENLALCTSAKEALLMGPFFNRVLSKVPKSFLLLDLHNIFCTALNYKIPIQELIETYPLDRVTEIHISGGSESHTDHPLGKFRRDSHDSAVPPEVFQALADVLPKLKNLKFIVLEQLPQNLRKKEEQAQFQADFKTMRKVVANHERK